MQGTGVGHVTEVLHSTMAAAAGGGGTALLSMVNNDDDDTYPSAGGGASSLSSSALNDDEVTVQYTMNHMIVQFGYPLLRLCLALLIIYLASGVSS